MHTIFFLYFVEIWDFVNVRKTELGREQPRECIRINNVPLINYERNN